MKARLRRIYDFAKLVLRGYSEDNGSMAAAAVSFYVFLSLIPVALLAIAAAGFVLGSEENARKVVFDYFRQYWPSAAQQSGGIQEILDEVVSHREAATGVGLVALLWTGVSTATTLEKAINVAWGVTARRSYVRQRAAAFGVLAAVAVLLGASFACTAAIQAADDLGLNWPWVFDVLGLLLPIVVTIGAFTLVYKVLPYTEVSWRVALTGGVFAGVLWEIAKQAFSVYVTSFSDYSKIYGSLGGLVLLAVWINYSAVVTILGAEVASEAARTRGAASDER